MNSIEGKTTIENIEKQTEAKVEASEKLTAEAQQVSSTLESIDTTGLDPEDISAYNETKTAERADHSKAQGASNVDVDYTLVRHVKKPAGSKPGFVVYQTNWSATVTPDEKKVRTMLQK